VYPLSQPERIRDLLKLTKPDLFLFDYNMPGYSGFHLIPIIRQYPDHDNTPVIYLTSEGTANHITEAKKLGASDFMIKPIDKDILLEKVGQQLKDYMIKRRMRYMEL
jgi:PleD family two-component response regulator